MLFNQDHTNLIKELAKLQFIQRRHQMKDNFTIKAKGKLLWKLKENKIILIEI